jgi:uncharacterized protein YhaN
MRLRRLNLERYGRFTDHCIDFGERPEGGPDLHIIYGPNEAGKSTALNAFLDLLFGIEPRSRYNFIHPYPTMRIGASLELSTGVRDLARVRRGLLDGQDQAIADGVILGELGGINRDAYRAMFSLDDETLEAGGESILASKGELGQLLFSASAGLAEMSRSLTGLRGEADGFYKFKARSGELSDLKKELAGLKDERDRIDTLASEYARLTEVRDRTSGLYDEAIADRGRVRTRMDDIQRHLNALPRLTALRTLREQLAPLEGLPEVPFGRREALPDLQKEDVSLATRAAGIDADIGRMSGELDAVVLDEPALEVAERLEGLSLLKSRHETADKDLPDRRLKLGEIKRSIAGLLARLGRPDEEDPHRLVLAASSVGILRDLIETRSGIQAAVDAATAELSQAGERQHEAEAAIRAAGGDIGTTEAGRPGLGLLAGTVATLRSGDHAARRREASRSIDARKESLAERLASLRPWQGSADDLSALAVPSVDALERIGATLTTSSEQMALQSGAVDRLDRERRRLEAEITAMKTVAGVVTDGEAAEVRAERERTWAEHRRCLDAESADLFETAMRRDDFVAEGHLRHGKEAAELQQSLRRLAVLDEDLRQAREQLVEATGRWQAALDELAATIATLSPALSGGMTIAELEAWLGLRDRALEARTELKQAERTLRDADAGAETARTTLRTAMDTAGLSYDEAADYAALMALAQRALDRETSLEGLRSAVKVSTADVKTREKAFEKAATADEDWQANWVQACARCWLGEEGATPAVSTVREVLEVLAALMPALELRSGLGDRIAKMEDDQAAFDAEVTGIATAIELPVEGVAPLRLAGLIQARVQEARDAVSAALAMRRSLEEVHERRRVISEELTVHQARTVEMTTFFSVDTLAEVARKTQESELKSGLSAQVEAAEQEILEAVRVGSIAEAEIVLDTADRSGLEAELSQLQSRFEDKDQRARDLFAERREAEGRIEAVGGDDAVARIEERRRTALLEIEERAERYLRLRLGVLAAVQALRAYRDQHRGSMMTRASEAFRTISRSSYTGLATQPDDDREILVALSSDGGSKVASELSKGTRFQLYLALRVAGYHEFARTRRPVPFVADDIMETFDDFRAEEAFGLFAGMAEVGQVVYLTHHRHLCAIAQKICPGVRVHELDGVR